MSCHYIGRGLDSVANVVLDLYESQQISKEGAVRLILACRKGVNWCDGNEGEAIAGTVKRGYCGLCFEKKENLTNVFDNELRCPERDEVFCAYEDTAAHYWLCPECKKQVLEEYKKTRK